MAKTNDLVSFLRCYGPIPTSDNMYDELIQKQVERYNVEPVEIPPARLQDLVDNFSQPEPNNIILTGTAGDGKTYHCRRAWEELNGDKNTWLRGDKIAKLDLSSGRILKIVKDLSELTTDEKIRLFPDLCKALLGEIPHEVYLVAANDGQLLSTFRDWAENENQKALDVFKKVEAMLVEEREDDEELDLRLYNLSRMDPSKDFDALLKEVVNHPKWSDCEGCSLYPNEEETICPIRINRALLVEATSKNPFKKRLGELLKLASANRLHLPIRHLLLLAVNILLGDRKPPKNLLTCTTARNRANNNDYDLTNPYANVFGINLPSTRRCQYQVFNVLDTFGIGRETENDFDNLLVYGRHNDKECYQRVVENDVYYGAKSYERLLEDYLEGERENKSLDSFMRKLERQRQRLFFSLSERDETNLNPWHLTVYRYAGIFLEFLTSDENDLEVGTQLVRGLNRTFCGMMIDDAPKLYIASSGGDGRGYIAPILEHEVEIRLKRRTVYISFDKIPELPGLRILVIDQLKPQKPICQLSLQLTHFEYLMRVAQGSLPTSFSRQCYEDFLDFKIIVIEKLNKEFGLGQSSNDQVEFRVIQVEADGRPDIEEISVERR